MAKVPASVIRLGDVIQFRQSKDVSVLHRVIEIDGEDRVEYFVTKGDANSSPDADPVIPENIVGKVVLTIPKVGWVSIMIKNFFAG